MEKFLQVNQARWDELVPIHSRSESYGLEGFKAGELSLMPIELEELGDVAGRSLLHLQCHFGMDTLSWARLGAEVTGIDYSQAGIDLARELGEELGIPAHFVCSNIYDLPSVLTGKYDIVFTSYGVLCWLPDLTRWAQVIAHFLKPGGTFYIVEMHPFGVVFDDEIEAGLKVRYPYFHSERPMRFDYDSSYASGDTKVSHTESYEWFHSLGDIINSLTGVGLRIEFLHEFPYCVYKMLPFMEKGKDGWWRLPDQQDSIPLMFSLKASL